MPAEAAQALPDYVALGREYYERSREGFPRLRALVFRGQREDMLPGFSDIDMRLICDDVEPEGWLALDEAVGRVQRLLAGRGPAHAHAIEHPPGACATVAEVLDPALYHPEMRQWDVCRAEPPLPQQLGAYLAGRPWGAADEDYALGRFLYSLAATEPEPSPPAGALARHHGLPSLVLHRFLPGLQAALSLLQGRAVPGRIEALRLWLSLRPRPPLAEVAAAIEGRLAAPAGAEAVAALRRQCHGFLEAIAPEVFAGLRFRRLEGAGGAERLRAALAAKQAAPLQTLYDAVRFSRIRRCHFLWFLEAPLEAKEAGYLVRNEIDTLRGLLSVPAFRAYAVLQWGRDMEAEAVIEALPPALAGTHGREAARRLLAIAHGAPGEARALLAEAAALYPAYHPLLERMLAAARAAHPADSH